MPRAIRFVYWLEAVRDSHYSRLQCPGPASGAGMTRAMQ
jgi:hypothetical protein